MMGINIFLPDTPYFLLMKPTTPTASTFKVNLRRFRSSRFNVDAELEALYDFRNENNIRRLKFLTSIIFLIIIFCITFTYTVHN